MDGALADYGSVDCIWIDVEAAGFLGRPVATYGAIHVIDSHSALEVADRSVLMDKSRTEDWSLFLSTKP